MKVIPLVLLALVLAAPALVADDAAPTVKWSIGTWTGFGVQTDTKASKTTFENYDYNWEGGSAYRVKLAITAADGNSGFAVRSQMSPGTATGTTAGDPLIGVGSFKLNQLYGFGKFMDGKIKVMGGMLDDYSIATAGWENFGKTDGSFGGYLNFAPMDGFNLGWFLPFNTTAPSPTAANQIGKSLVGFSYTVPDMAFIAAGIYFSPKTNGTSYYAGVDFKGVKDLTLQIEAKLTAVGDKVNGLTQVAEYVKYPFGTMAFSMYAGETMYAAKTSALGYNFEPMLSYSMSDTVTLALLGNVYVFNADELLTFLSPVDGLAALTTTGYGLGAASGKAAFGGGPQIAFKSGGMSVVLGDYFAVLPSVGATAATNINLVYAALDYSL
jgi:hypothetical protein